MLLGRSAPPLLAELAAEALDVAGGVVLVLCGEVGGRVDVLEVVLEGRSADHAAVA